MYFKFLKENLICLVGFFLRITLFKIFLYQYNNFVLNFENKKLFKLHKHDIKKKCRRQKS